MTCKASHSASRLLPAGGLLTCTESVHVGNYHKAAKLLQAPTISVCCLPQESLCRAKTRGWKGGTMTQVREQQNAECKWYGVKEKPMQIFSEEVTYWAFCSLLRVMERLQFVPQPGALWGAWVVFSCFSWPGSGFKVMWFLQTCWLPKEENKQSSDFLPCPLPGGILSSPTWNHLSLSPPEHKSPNTKPVTSTFPSLHQASWKTEPKCIRQQVKFKQSLNVLYWHHASPVYKLSAYKNVKYGSCVCGHRQNRSSYKHSTPALLFTSVCA